MWPGAPVVMRNRQVAVVAVVYVCCIFLASVDTSIVNVALPSIGADLHQAPSALAAVSTTYLLSTAVCIPASGWLGDRFGGRTVILGGTALFTIASVLCGVAGSLSELLAARVLQGGAAGLMTPVGLAVLFRLVSPAERIRLGALISIPTSLGPALGPVLGGFLTTDLSWRWAFLVNAPVGVAVVVFGALYLDAHRRSGGERLDVAGLALAGSGLGLSLLGVAQAPQRGWSDPLVVITLAAGGTLLVALVPVERRVRNPLFDAGVLRDRGFSRSTIVLVVGSFGLSAWLYLMSQFNQHVLGLDPLVAGAVTIPLAVGYLVGAQLASRIVFPRVGPRWAMVAGLLALAACMAGMTLIGRPVSYAWFELLLFASGCCVPVVFLSSQTAAFSTVSAAGMGRASMMYSASRQVSAAVGIAFAATGVGVLAATPSSARVTSPAAYHWVFLTIAALVACGAACFAALGDDGVE